MTEGNGHGSTATLGGVVVEPEQAPARAPLAAPGHGHPLDDLPPDDEVRRPLSPFRILAVLVLLAGIGSAAYFGVKRQIIFGPTVRATTWFAPYVDVTSTPVYPFQDPSDDPARQTVLGFITAAGKHACAPSWGGVYSLAGADASLSMASRIAQLQDQGASAVVSFGGAAHTPLTAACATAGQLEQAYQQVVTHYNLRAIDLDMEGTGLASLAGDEHQAQAVRALQLWGKQHHRPIAVWLTLPVATDGLQGNAQTALLEMLRARVALAGVNAMAMDFSPVPKGTTMAQAVEQSLSAMAPQVQRAFGEVGIHLTGPALWRRLGATVMIGQNNVRGERFTISDAKTFLAFAHRSGLGRVSFWSINRDRQCGNVYAITGVEVDNCSGTAQTALEFSKIFSSLNGAITAQPSAALPPAPNANPADAPYPLWSPTVPYPQGYLVVRDGEIYEAKWYNAGQDPATQVAYAWQTPWQLIGPVLPGDHAPAPAKVPPGTYAEWSATTVYQTGDKVLFNGLPFQAKWDNEGANPRAAVGDPASSPWQPLYTIPGEPKPLT